MRGCPTVVLFLLQGLTNAQYLANTDKSHQNLEWWSLVLAPTHVVNRETRILYILYTVGNNDVPL